MQQTAGTHRRWFSPVEALDRFAPPPGMDTGLESTPGTHGRFGFRVGNLGLVIKAGTRSQVIVPPPISPLPKTPTWLRGLINLRGNLVPVFDLNLLLEMEASAQAKRMLLVLDEGDAMVGMLIEGLPQSVEISRELQRLPPVPEVLKEHVPRGYTHEGRIWLEFDHAAFFKSLAARMAP
jgi:twitching motility protein PilI